jgi:hypothetical protein
MSGSFFSGRLAAFLAKKLSLSALLLIGISTYSSGQTATVKVSAESGNPLGDCKHIPFEGTAAVNAIPYKLGVLLHAVFLKNESRASNAYCLSNAKMASGLNGISFGIRQWDLAQGAQEWKDFVEIVTKADIPPGQDALKTILNSENLLRGCIGPKKKFKPDSDKCKTFPVIDFNDAATKKAVAATAKLLQEPEGRKALDAKYVANLTAQLRRFDVHIGRFTPAMGMKALVRQSDTASLLILDYENLFGADCFYAAMKQLPYVCNKKIPRLAPDGEEITEGDFIRYLLDTGQGKSQETTGERDVFRRIENVLEVAKFNPDLTLPKYSRDKEFYTTVMDSRLTEMRQRSKTQNVSVNKMPNLDRLIAASKLQ